MWINGFTIDGVECDLALLHRRMKERKNAIGWNRFIPYDEYQFHI